MTDSRARIRVLLLHPFDAFAGSQRVAAALARALESAGFAVLVHLGFGTRGFVSQVAGVRRFLGIDRIPLRKLLYPLWLVAVAPRVLWAVWRAEVVWANTVHAIPAVLPALWLAPRRVVLHVHEIEFPRLFARLLRWSARRGARVLCVSHLHRDRLGIDEAHVLPNAVDPASDSEPFDPPVVVFVGAVSALKGFPLFVEVAKRLSHERVRTVACVPSIPEGADALLASARSAGVDIRCGLTSPAAMFGGAMLTLQCTDPSLWTETFSLVMVESLSCGVPVATAGMAVAPEILADAWAFDVPSRDPDRMAAEVLALAADKPRLQRLRSAARARRAHFSVETFSMRASDIVRAVGESKRG